MIIFKSSDQISQHIIQQKKSGKKTGFVPTMGALHQGHLSLVECARKENDLTICSIFVNPTQFNNPEDFKLYPVTIEKDLEQLIISGCDVLFMPSVSEMYPTGQLQKQYDLGAIENILEGYYRPGHFQGVCQIVDRMLGIVQPDNLYMGQKDFQQCMVIHKLLQLIGKDKEIHLNIVPTARETDGLAMSSRNLRLNNDQRQLAPSIYKELSFIKQQLPSKNFNELKAKAKEHLTQKGFKVDYVEIANAQDLSEATKNSDQLVALAAASIENIRLIDNLLLN
ncbi:MAG: pantoate--beta-alanine ligase [Flavisolibacter sp.]